MDQQLEVAEEERYLVFKLGGELYGTPLLGVREVVEAQPSKEIPHSLPHFAGIINIRGEIVGVIDLRVRFGHPTVESKRNAMMVFQTSGGPMAALVDEIEAVQRIPSGEITKDPNVRTAIPADFLIGIAKHGGRLITVIDLNSTLGAEHILRVK